jgi:uncharacterized protein
MNFRYHVDIAAPPSAVWDFLWQPQRVCGCLPGCQKVTTHEPLQRYEATVEERVGPFKARFDWDIQVTQREPIEFARVVAHGKDRALGATARADLQVRLSSEVAGRTALEIETGLQITGRIATLGQTVIKRKADEVVKDFAEGLRAHLEASEVQRQDA